MTCSFRIPHGRGEVYESDWDLMASYCELTNDPHLLYFGLSSWGNYLMGTLTRIIHRFNGPKFRNYLSFVNFLKILFLFKFFLHLLILL